MRQFDVELKCGSERNDDIFNIDVESSLGMCPTTINPLFPFIVTLPVTANFSKRLLCFI